MTTNIRPLTNRELFEMNAPIQGMQAASQPEMRDVMIGMLVAAVIIAVVWVIVN